MATYSAIQRGGVMSLYNVPRKWKKDFNIKYEDWLRGCVHHDGRHGYVTLPCDEVLKIADFIERLRADRKTEPQTELVNDSPILVKDLVDDEFNPYDEECMRCKHLKLQCEFVPSYCKYELRDKPQTERGE